MATVGLKLSLAWVSGLMFRVLGVSVQGSGFSVEGLGF